MVNLWEMILMGIFATYFMDILAKYLVKFKIVRAAIEPHIPGRWVLYMLKGKFIHKNIRQIPALKTAQGLSDNRPQPELRRRAAKKQRALLHRLYTSARF